MLRRVVVHLAKQHDAMPLHCLHERSGVCLELDGPCSGDHGRKEQDGER